MATVSLYVDCPSTGYTLSWNTSIGTFYGGYLKIYVNSSLIVYQTFTDFGDFIVQYGDYVTIEFYAETYSNLTAYTYLYKDYSSMPTVSEAATQSVTLTHGFTVYGDTYIDTISYDYV